MNTAFGIIGGDKRQLYLARSILKDGYCACVSGFELSGDTEGLCELPADALTDRCDIIILPLPASKDGHTVFAPFSEREIVADEKFVSGLRNKIVYGGLMSRLTVGQDACKDINYSDYYLREELAVSNAVPTAEGAICLAVEAHPGTISSSNCLVTGFGKIGKILSKLLISMGAELSVAARKSSDLAMIRAFGAKPVKYGDIREKFDIIFNTVPEEVITPRILSFQDSNTAIIELATLPGGINRKAAALAGIKITEAQSLPGKYSPMSSGEYIKECIYNMLEE